MMERLDRKDLVPLLAVFALAGCGDSDCELLIESTAKNALAIIAEAEEVFSGAQSIEQTVTESNVHEGPWYGNAAEDPTGRKADCGFNDKTGKAVCELTTSAPPKTKYVSVYRSVNSRGVWQLLNVAASTNNFHTSAAQGLVSNPGLGCGAHDDSGSAASCPEDCGEDISSVMDEMQRLRYRIGSR